MLEVARGQEPLEALHVEEQAVLLRLSQALLSAVDTQTVMDQAVRVVAEAFNSEFTALVLVDEEGQRHSLWAGIGWSPETLLQAQETPLDGTVFSQMIQTQTPVIIPDVSSDRRFTQPPWLAQMEITAALLVPMLVAERPLGGLIVASVAARNWDEDDVRLLSLISRTTAQVLERACLFEAERAARKRAEALQAAAAIENARLFDEADQRLEELASLNMVGQAITSSLDLQETLSIITDVTRRLLELEAVSVVLYDELAEDLWFAAASGAGTQLLQGKRLALGQGVVGWVVQHGEPALVPDVSQDPRFFGDIDRESGLTTHSILCVPLQAKGQTIGAIEVMNKRRGPFDEKDAALLSSLAAFAATAIENARLYERTDARLWQTNRRLMLINRVTRRLTAILDVDQLLAEVLGLVKDNLGCHYTAVALLEGDEIVFRASSCAERSIPPGTRLKVEKRDITAWVASHGQALNVPDVTQDTRYFQHPQMPNIRSQMVVPIQIGDCMLGVVNVGSNQVAAFDQDDLNLLQAIAGQLALTLENARAYQEAQAQRDEATAVTKILFQETDRVVAMNRVVTALLDVPEEEAAAAALVNGLRDEMGVQMSMLWLAGRSGQDLRLAAAVGMGSDEAQVSRCARCPVLTQVWRTRQKTSSEQLGDSPDCPVCLDDWLMLPIEAHNERLGVLVTDRKSVDEDTLRILINQAALGLAAARSYGHLREQAQTLEKTNAELIRATQAKTDFLNRMSHELRTPLTSIIGFAELLLIGRAGPISEKQTHYAEQILYSGRHQLALVNDLLDLAKIEAGKMELHLEQVAVSALLDEVATMMAARAEEKGLKLETNPTDLQVRVMGDMTRLRQVLLNLVGNAIKFTPAEGSVKMKAELMSDFDGEAGQSAVVVSVADTGIGIKEEDFPKVFALFEQVESPLIRAQEGTGLGLALTKHLVELHGGCVWFESAYGKGTTFFVALPVEREV
jgi:signal transduction histidine kinase/GAF domain-containing protein